MIPPNQAARQALQMRQQMMMNGQQPEDPLMQALGRQQMLGDMLKETAGHHLKMLKMKIKYGNAMQPQGPPPGAGGGMNGPQGQTYY